MPFVDRAVCMTFIYALCYVQGLVFRPIIPIISEVVDGYL